MNFSGGGLEDRALKRIVARNTTLLSASMAALYGMGQLAAAVATLTFVAVVGVSGLVGLAPAVFLATAALAALPAGRAMDRFGRVPVLATGFGLGILGSVLTALGALWMSATAVILGFVLIGSSTGTVMLSRTAAADMYPPERRARGIALILFGALFGALLGPLVFVPLFAGEAPGAESLVVPWLAAAGFMAVGLVLVSNVRPDPQRIGKMLAEQAQAGTEETPAAPLSGILRRRGVVPALSAAAASWAVMVGLMTLTGFVLVDHGHSQSAVFPVLSAHYVGMFALVLVVGNVIDRLGRVRALAGGLLLLGISSLALVWAAESVVATSITLLGVGLGWNFSYVAATAELAERATASERGKLLGTSDLISGLLGAVLTFLGGVALTTVLGVTGLGVAGAIISILPAFWITKQAAKVSARGAS